MFGLKFWAFVVGAAPLPPALEEFWKRLGFVVIQGYGLTETAPIVTLNHPFKTTSGIRGHTDRAASKCTIADDGEILVRGENVTTGYYEGVAGAAGAGGARVPGARVPEPGSGRTIDDEGWLHTGDIGEKDAQGRALHQGPQEGNDRHAGRAECLSGRCGAGARTRSRV